MDRTECYNHAAHMIYDNSAKRKKRRKLDQLSNERNQHCYYNHVIKNCKPTMLLQTCHQKLYVELGIPVKIPRSFETHPHCMQCRGDVGFQSRYFSNGYPFTYLKAFQISDLIRYTFQNSLYTELYCNENNN